MNTPNDMTLPEMAARLLARDKRQRNFDRFCHNCQCVQRHLVEDNTCRVCAPLTNREHAQSLGKRQYLDTCPTHGLTMFNTRSGKCDQCFTAAGIQRSEREINVPRANARRAGAISYVATCEKHGPVPFSTHTGKCLTCFNAQGYPRKMMRIG